MVVFSGSGNAVFSGPGTVSFTFSPETISGLTLWIDPSQNVTLDSGRVAEIIDCSSNEVVFTQADSGNRPDINSSAINGRPSLRADATLRWLSSDAQPSISDYTIFAIRKVSSGTATWFSKGSTQATNEMYFFTGANVTIAGSSFDGLGAFQHTLQAQTFPNTGYTSFETICLTKSGMHVHLYVDGTLISASEGSNAALINPMEEQWDLFGRSGSTNTEIAYLLVYDNRLSPTDLERVQEFLDDRFGTVTVFAPDNTDLPGIFFMGDSLTVGVDSVPPPIRCVDNASVGLNRTVRIWDYANQGLAGRTIEEALAGIDDEVIQWLNNGDLVEVWLGTNDIRGGRTAMQINADIDAYCQAIRNTGKAVTIVLTTVLNALDFTGGKGSQDGAESGIQASVNTHMRGLVGTLADAVYDAQAETDLQTTTTAPNTYFNADGVHLTVAGSNIISDGWIATIEGL